MSDYGDQVTLARLYEKTSAKDNQYFVGRLGMAKVVVLKSKETAENGDAIWNVVISEGQNDKRPAPRPEQGTGASVAPSPAGSRAATPEANTPAPLRATFNRVMADEEIRSEDARLAATAKTHSSTMWGEYGRC